MVVVDDDEQTGFLLRFILDDCDVTLFTGNWQRMKRDPIWERADVAIVDLFLGFGMSGEEILVWLTSYHPNVRRIALSAIPERLPTQEPLAHTTVAKPFEPEAIRAAVTG